MYHYLLKNSPVLSFYARGSNHKNNNFGAIFWHLGAKGLCWSELRSFKYSHMDCVVHFKGFLLCRHDYTQTNPNVNTNHIKRKRIKYAFGPNQTSDWSELRSFIQTKIILWYHLMASAGNYEPSQGASTTRRFPFFVAGHWGKKPPNKTPSNFSFFCPHWLDRWAEGFPSWILARDR